MGKQDRRLETWSLHTRIERPGKNRPLYVGMFFVTGKLYFFKGNFVHILWLDTASGEYGHESDILVPPFARIEHDTEKLNEQFNRNALLYDQQAHAIRVTGKFSAIQAHLTMRPEKSKLWFNQIFSKNKGDMIFDWYMLPKMLIEGKIGSTISITADGEGHFQHYWGDDVAESGDFIVGHTESGYDFIISDMLDQDAHLPHMPKDYILISPPGNEKRIIRQFDYSNAEWWRSGRTGNRYPIRVLAESRDDSVLLEIRALRKNQAGNMLGVEKWLGYGSVAGTINGEPQTGWAFMSMHGETEK